MTIPDILLSFAVITFILLIIFAAIMVITKNPQGEVFTLIGVAVVILFFMCALIASYETEEGWMWDNWEKRGVIQETDISKAETKNTIVSDTSTIPDKDKIIILNNGTIIINP